MKKLFFSVLFLLSGFFIFAEGNIRSVSSKDFDELCQVMYDTLENGEDTELRDILLNFVEKVKEINKENYNENISEEVLKTITVRYFFKVALGLQDNINIMSDNTAYFFNKVNHIESISNTEICNSKMLLEKMEKGYVYVGKNTVNLTESIKSGNCFNLATELFFAFEASSILSDEYVETTDEGDTYPYFDYNIYYLKDNELYLDSYTFSK